MPKLRSLQIKDSRRMYSWMTDADASSQLTISRYPSSEETVIEFIRNSWVDRCNIHYAIVTDDDEYVGTVSLKNINQVDRNAEYAIAVSKEYWGKGYSKYATDEIVSYGFRILNLEKIYLSVASSNIRAVKFYEKYGFNKEGIFRKHIFINGKYDDLFWYSIFNER